jgi:hypothetical protein
VLHDLLTDNWLITILNSKKIRQFQNKQLRQCLSSYNTIQTAKILETGFARMSIVKRLNIYKACLTNALMYVRLSSYSQASEL